MAGITRVAVDLDDVCLDFVGGLIASVKKEYDIELTEDDINQWDLHTILDPIIGRSWWSWLRDREWLWATFPAVDGAIGMLGWLRKEGYYLECLTSKPEWAEHSVFQWLGKWRPPFNRITIVGTKQDKIAYSESELLIDDKPENCLGFIEGGRKAILFSRPHNRSIDVSPPLVRAWNWHHVRQLFEEGTIVGRNKVG